MLRVVALLLAVTLAVILATTAPSVCKDEDYDDAPTRCQ